MNPNPESQPATPAKGREELLDLLREIVEVCKIHLRVPCWDNTCASCACIVLRKAEALLSAPGSSEEKR